MTILKSFEKPLTPEEELKYLTKFKEEQDKHAKEILIERNMRLVAHIAKKYNNSSEDQDDLISIGTIGLIKAIETYNIEKGTRLATYASKCIENEILMNIRTNKKNKAQVSLQDPIGMDKEGNEISLIEVLGTDIDYILDQVELKVQISKLYEQLDKILTKREKEIVLLRYGLTTCGYKTQREIAEKLEISRSYVSRIEKRALKKLQKELKSEKSLI
ncbi:MULTISPECIES: RNA polymerase sporulation sigma factor SigK [Romboutsia]|uniref:RNA polymerase sigma factor n=2 Tax=Romboutsia ilealis TaxID=1115758 RepID=A0A1V1I2L3_9FIRM|nr:MULTISPECIES: RNA polymerase sporulation sigma factor SigK [Romboutsia]MCI9061565.1 RNA polymerase sporulation sigma factor SigK [Romboutsia sp.]MCI9258850.1 RNA polymerase sporulation sigma factor SigK [Romboutsia sp.]CED94492.1 spore_sigmaK: RNA polymerase sigma-K factor [Romboutsia ilealis]